MICGFTLPTFSFRSWRILSNNLRPKKLLEAKAICFEKRWEIILDKRAKLGKSGRIAMTKESGTYCLFLVGSTYPDYFARAKSADEVLATYEATLDDLIESAKKELRKQIRALEG